MSSGIEVVSDGGNSLTLSNKAEVLFLGAYEVLPNQSRTWNSFSWQLSLPSPPWTVGLILSDTSYHTIGVLDPPTLTVGINARDPYSIATNPVFVYIYAWKF